MLCKVYLLGYLNRYFKNFKDNFEIEVDRLMTPLDILEKLGIPFSEVEAVFIDGKMARFTEPLAEVKKVEFLATVSGG